MAASDVIVAGVDGSEGGRRALRWAVDEAARTGATVRAVTAWTWDCVGTPLLGSVSPSEARTRAEAISIQEVASAIADIAAPPAIVREVVRGDPVAVLVSAGRRARMLVLGGHGEAQLYRAVLGAVSAGCVRTACTAVVVVPVPEPPTAAKNA